MATTGATIKEAGHGGILSARSRDRLRRYLAAYVFLVPTFVFIGYFLYYPAYRALTGGFTFWDGFNAPEYIGLDNFRRAAEDQILRIATKNNLIWAAIEITLAIIPSFTVAALIFHVKRDGLRYLYRTLFVVPIIIPAIVTILLWRYYYQGDGLINVLLERVGLDRLTHFWIADPGTALYALALMGFPWVNAFNMLIFFAGLQNIPTEIMEAAELDGATGMRRLWTIEIPMVLAQFKLLLILAIITSGQNIVTPLVMTQGGPGYSTYTVSYYMYETAVEYGEFGYSMAIALLLFVFILVLTAINQRFIRD
ncbi:MAG TPA: sugar ABC transporter permease [Thermomicrobiales bacterium]|jgi:ABC-type sugar transport system permease subunit|nr:sugar ABC transporter permease [Thermomicrobiales bacterium]